jgi:hypothetical protein
MLNIGPNRTVFPQFSFFVRCHSYHNFAETGFYASGVETGEVMELRQL